MTVASVMKSAAPSVAPSATLDEVRTLMRELGVRHLPVVEADDPVGVVSERELLLTTGGLPLRVEACRGGPPSDRVPRSVAELRLPAVVRAAPEDTLEDAARLLARSPSGALLVVRGKRAVGLLTDVDLLRAYIDARPGRWRSPKVAECMGARPVTIDWFASLGQALALCREGSLRHLVVVEGGRPVGMVSDRDLLRALGAGRHSDLPVDEIGTRPVVTASGEAELVEAARLMYAGGFSSLPVVGGIGGAGRGEEIDLIGILTTADVLTCCLEPAGRVGCRSGNGQAPNCSA